MPPSIKREVHFLDSRFIYHDGKCSFSELQRLVALVFNIEKGTNESHLPDHVALQYEDDEGDIVTVASEVDWAYVRDVLDDRDGGVIVPLQMVFRDESVVVDDPEVPLPVSEPEPIPTSVPASTQPPPANAAAAAVPLEQTIQDAIRAILSPEMISAALQSVPQELLAFAANANGNANPSANVSTPFVSTHVAVLSPQSATTPVAVATPAAVATPDTDGVSTTTNVVKQGNVVTTTTTTVRTVETEKQQEQELQAESEPTTEVEDSETLESLKVQLASKRRMMQLLDANYNFEALAGKQAEAEALEARIAAKERQSVDAATATANDDDDETSSGAVKEDVEEDEEEESYVRHRLQLDVIMRQLGDSAFSPSAERAVRRKLKECLHIPGFCFLLQQVGLLSSVSYNCTRDVNRFAETVMTALKDQHARFAVGRCPRLVEFLADIGMPRLPWKDMDVDSLTAYKVALCMQIEDAVSAESQLLRNLGLDPDAIVTQISGVVDFVVRCTQKEIARTTELATTREEEEAAKEEPKEEEEEEKTETVLHTWEVSVCRDSSNDQLFAACNNVPHTLTLTDASLTLTGGEDGTQRWPFEHIKRWRAATKRSTVCSGKRHFVEFDFGHWQEENVCVFTPSGPSINTKLREAIQAHMKQKNEEEHEDAAPAPAPASIPAAADPAASAKDVSSFPINVETLNGTVVLNVSENDTVEEVKKRAIAAQQAQKAVLDTNTECAQTLTAQLDEVSEKETKEEEGPAHHAFCDHCNGTIRGVRFKCGNCVDYDLCAACEALLPGVPVHDATHVFLKIRVPLPPRFAFQLSRLLPPMYPGDQTAPAPTPHTTHRACGAPPSQRIHRLGRRHHHHQRAAVPAPAPAPLMGDFRPPRRQMRPCRPVRFSKSIPTDLAPVVVVSPRLVVSMHTAHSHMIPWHSPSATVDRELIVRNSGTSPWPAQGHLVLRVEHGPGNAIGALLPVIVKEDALPLAPNAEITLAVRLTLPAEGGTHSYICVLSGPAGEFDGKIMFKQGVYGLSSTMPDQEQATIAITPATVKAIEAAAEANVEAVTEAEAEAEAENEMKSPPALMEDSDDEDGDVLMKPPPGLVDDSDDEGEDVLVTPAAAPAADIPVYNPFDLTTDLLEADLASFEHMPLMPTLAAAPAAVPYLADELPAAVTAAVHAVTTSDDVEKLVRTDSDEWVDMGEVEVIPSSAAVDSASELSATDDEKEQEEEKEVVAEKGDTMTASLPMSTPEQWGDSLLTLNAMGFEDRAQNIAALFQYNGDVGKTITALLELNDDSGSSGQRRSSWFF